MRVVRANHTMKLWSGKSKKKILQSSIKLKGTAESGGNSLCICHFEELLLHTK